MMIAIDNNPHDAMKTERGVSILKRYFKMRKLKKNVGLLSDTTIITDIFIVAKRGAKLYCTRS